MPSGRWTPLLILLVAPTVAVVGCAPLNGLAKWVAKLHDSEVEISPDEWITIQEYYSTFRDELGHRKEKSRLVIPWNGQQVTWEAVAIPFTLREFDGALYVAAFDRETDFSHCRFRYYKQDGTSFTEIPHTDFPKQIATQNMWIRPDSCSTGMDNKKHYDLEMTQLIDPDDIYFHSTLTARMWVHLATGKDYHEQDQGEQDHEVVRQFKQTYRPVPLPTIVKTRPEPRGEHDGDNADDGGHIEAETIKH